MKILLPLAAFALTVVIAASCKKREYVCTCSESHGGQTVTNNYPLGNINDNTAQDECNGTQEYLAQKGIPAKCYTTY